MIEERTLGRYLPNYQSKIYNDWLIDTLSKEGFFKLSDKKTAREALDSVKEAECFLRNVFYIVKHSGRKTATAWDHVAFGSDFDGFINPLNICETAERVPFFKEYLIKFIPYFLKIHEEYQLPGESQGLLFDLTPEQAMNKLFYQNGTAFVQKYF